MTIPQYADEGVAVSELVKPTPRTSGVSTPNMGSLELRTAAWVVRNTVDMTDKPDTQE